MYDWMMLNGGKGWEAGTVSHSHSSSSSNSVLILGCDAVGIKPPAIDESTRLRIRPTSSSLWSTARSRSRKRASGTTCSTSRRRRRRHHQHSRWTRFSLRRAREERVEIGSKSLWIRNAECQLFRDRRQGRFGRCGRKAVLGEYLQWRRRISESSVRFGIASAYRRIR